MPTSNTPARARRSQLARDLALLMVVGILLAAAIVAGGLSLYRAFYSPAAFVEQYLQTLADGRAADALRMPGVSISRDAIEEISPDEPPSAALLRSTALSTLTDIEIVAEQEVGESHRITASYIAGGYPATSEFVVTQRGWIGIAPRWSFVDSPLGIVDLVVLGSDRFSVNGFDLDRRQVAAEGVESDALDPVPLLVFSPGFYSITVDTRISYSSGIGLLADAPLAVTSVQLQTQPTDEFITVVQEQVNRFLDQCTTQQVLLPTACPFGYEVEQRLASDPVWSIASYPDVTLVPDGAHWRMPPSESVAHVDVDVQSIFDGQIYHLQEEVPFEVGGTVQIMPDGSASIRIGTSG